MLLDSFDVNGSVEGALQNVALFITLWVFRRRCDSVTGQRSNQLNYVPSCFSYG